MRENPDYAMPDPRDRRALVDSLRWGALVSHTDAGLVVSHYPFLLEPVPDDGDDDEAPLVLLSHVGRPDEREHELGSHEVVVVFEGPTGYVSPSWYGTSPAVPTWDFAAVHVWGTPELLGDEENLAVLERMVDAFEGPLPESYRMRRSLENTAYAERIVRGTVGFRLVATRVEAKDKMHQDKPVEVVDRVVAALRADGPYRNPALADRVEARNADRPRP